MEILVKGTVSAEFQAILPKLCGNCVFHQNFHTRKLGEITVFYAVTGTASRLIKRFKNWDFKKLKNITKIKKLHRIIA